MFLTLRTFILSSMTVSYWVRKPIFISQVLYRNENSHTGLHRTFKLWSSRFQHNVNIVSEPWRPWLISSSQWRPQVLHRTCIKHINVHFIIQKFSMVCHIGCLHNWTLFLKDVHGLNVNTKVAQYKHMLEAYVPSEINLTMPCGSIKTVSQLIQQEYTGIHYTKCFCIVSSHRLVF
jgi:hypothetical protein